MPEQQHALLRREERRVAVQWGILHTWAWTLDATEVGFRFFVISHLEQAIRVSAKEGWGWGERGDNWKCWRGDDEEKEEEEEEGQNHNNNNAVNNNQNWGCVNNRRDGGEMSFRYICYVSQYWISLNNRKRTELTVVLRMTTRIRRRTTKLRTRVCQPHRHPSLCCWQFMF